VKERVREYWHDVVFRSLMFWLDVIFWKSKVTVWIRRILGMKPGLGFEDELEKSMRGLAKSSLGVEITADAFAG
jgi:aarF domain-containing kinase